MFRLNSDFDPLFCCEILDIIQVLGVGGGVGGVGGVGAGVSPDLPQPRMSKIKTQAKTAFLLIYFSIKKLL
jgi:hypothetical protein